MEQAMEMGGGYYLGRQVHLLDIHITIQIIFQMVPLQVVHHSVE